MKKLFVLALLFVCAGALYAADGDYFSTGPNEEFRVMANGILFSTAGFAAQDFWLDLPTASSISVRGSYVSTDVDVLKVSTQAIWNNGASGNWTRGATTYTVKDITQPVWPVSITGCIASTATLTHGANPATYAAVTASGTLKVYGTNAKGEIIDETIKISTGTPGQTLQAFATISSYTVTISTINGIPSSATEQSVCVIVGHGTIFGLKNNIENKSDIYKVFESTGDVNVNNTVVNTTYDTIKFNNAPNTTRDYAVWYRAKRTK